MQSVEFKVIPLDSNIFTVQKCLLPEGRFNELKCSECAFIHFSEHVKCVCRLYPRCDLQSHYCELDSSVVAFRGVERTLYGFPAALSDVCLNTDRHNVNAVQCMQSITYKKINLSVVFENVSNAKKWNSNLKTLSNVVKNILKFYMITNDSIITLGNLSTETKLGIHCIIVHNTNYGDSIIGRVVAATKVTVRKVISRKWFDQLQNFSCAPLGGLDKSYSTLKEIVTHDSRYRRLLQDANLKPCQQVLVAGPPGCGKTSLVRKVASDCEVGLVMVAGPQLFRPAPGDTDRLLRELFQEAVDLVDESGTCVLLLDEVDSLCPRRGGGSGRATRAATQLLALLEKVELTPGLVVMATTSRPHDLDPALRRPGRLELEVYVGVPTEPERAEILRAVLGRTWDGTAGGLEALCARVAHITPGYVGADLALVCQRVLFYKQKMQFLDDAGPPEFGVEEWAQWFQAAVANTRPSSLRSGLGVVTTRPASLSDIGGMDDVKKALRTAVALPLAHPEAFSKMGIPRPKGVLLYGPPGCAKTMVVRALATEVNTTFLSVSAAELYSPFVGDAERNVVELFSRARHGAPTILFIDEIDALVGGRGNKERSVQLQVLSAVLTEMDGVGVKLEVQEMDSQGHAVHNSGVMVIAATNRPDLLDDALLRPGRFDRLVHVPPPDEQSRLDVLRVCTRGMPLASDVDLACIACSTALFSGADIANLCREAALCALSTSGMDAQLVKHEDFQQALRVARPSLTQEQVEWYLNYRR